MQYWLMKTEPAVFSWNDLKAAPEQTTGWEGVRNYQARNFIRDKMKLGDLVFFYHSVVKPQAIAGIAKVVRPAYPDPFALDPASPYFDPKSSAENPTWLMVDIQAVQDLTPQIALNELKKIPELASMMLLQKGCRLSVQPVTPQEWQQVISLRA
ncbi:MAG: EVE domain-containing protein [Aphanocapsa sp. GSE-SYN-MK-11-07L]|jgi:predicted RNA-binding protein with PUA-like domain|nr:EVE domain-containing protein [Aphanocapsa sp. GSE-SYN-MK-11-07L]